MRRSLSGQLVLEDEGSFFVGGEVVATDYPMLPNTGLGAPGHITVNQMYVRYWIPAAKNDLAPVVMVHGSVHTGKTWETTPDGREGWATYFARSGFSVYAVDHCGRGRSGFNPSPINQARADSHAASLPAIQITTREGAWLNFRLGPSYGRFWPDSQFPEDAVDQYFSQLVPNAESTLVDGGANTVNALAALLDRIGPAIVMVHSQSGSYGLDLIRKRPKLVKGLINIEGSCTPVSAQEIEATLAKIPLLSLWGDHSIGAAGLNGDERRNGCMATVAALRAAGGRATFALLPDLGIRGNSHMLMLEKNNLRIADLVLEWIGENVPKNRAKEALI